MLRRCRTLAQVSPPELHRLINDPRRGRAHRSHSAAWRRDPEFLKLQVAWIKAAGWASGGLFCVLLRYHRVITSPPWTTKNRKNTRFVHQLLGFWPCVRTQPGAVEAGARRMPCACDGTGRQHTTIAGAGGGAAECSLLTKHLLPGGQNKTNKNIQEDSSCYSNSD